MAALTALSPRISFSHDIDLDLSLPAPTDSPHHHHHHHLDDASSSSSSSLAIIDDNDFVFSISLDAISIHDSSPADRLFSHGKLLPLNSTAQPVLNSHENETNASAKSPSPSFLNTVGRSSSVGAAPSSSSTKPRLSSAAMCLFPRSKSTGSCPRPESQKKKKQQQQQQQDKYRRNSLRNSYYYSGGGSCKRSGSYSAAVMINPVINVPTHFIPRGGSSSSGVVGASGSGGGAGGGGRSVNNIFAYLLCNCGGQK